MRSGIKWRFAPKSSRFAVELRLEREWRYRYDGDDSDGETQAKLDCGEYVAFGATVTVFLDGEEIAFDHLDGSVYKDGDESEFWTAHRGRDPMDRNCSIMRAKRGDNVAICHYFPGMVQAAIQEARKYVRNMATVPHIRESAK